MSVAAMRGRAAVSRLLKPRTGFLPCPHRPTTTTRGLTPAAASPPSVSILSRGISFSPQAGPDSGKLKRTTLPDFWLRDNCRCTSCVHQETMQRNFNTFEIPEDVHPLDVSYAADGVHVRWSDNSHESFYTWAFLRSYMEADRPQPEPVKPEYFNARGSSQAKSWPPSVNSDKFASDESRAVGEFTDLIRRFGFAFITGVPSASGEATKALLERIAFIRETHYGGFYDFVPDLAMADTAYTNVALGAHTDTTYFSDPAGLQAFHMLSHTADPNGAAAQDQGGSNLGGQSLLVDGFHAASLLRAEDPEAFAVLSQVRLPWHASGNEGITIAPDKLYPVLEVAGNENGDAKTGGGRAVVHRVRWNNDDRGVVPFGGAFSPEEWYAAARKWNAILRRKDVEYWFQLKPGNLLVFDNWRVLHGRAAFTGVRRMCGAYINRDDFISRWRNTNYSREEILRRIIG